MEYIPFLGIDDVILQLSLTFDFHFTLMSTTVSFSQTLALHLE